MKYIVLAILAFASSSSWAGADIECGKKRGTVECTANKEMTIVRVVLNGGECGQTRLSQQLSAGDKFVVPGSKECYYTRRVTLFSSAGKTYDILAL